MNPDRHDPGFFEVLLRRIREAVTEGVRTEVQRRREAGLPLHVEREGRVVTILPRDRQQS